MKKLVILVLGALFAVSCNRYPDVEDLDPQYLVQTNYDKSVNFKTRYTVPNNVYYMPDTIRFISDGAAVNPNWTDDNAKALLKQIENNMTTYGYTRTTDYSKKATSNLGIMVTMIKDLQYVSYYDPNWWWYYPAYWDPTYWGWLPWYYPYNMVYTYVTGSVLTEMVDLQNPDPVSGKLSVVWSSFSGGVMSGSTSTDISYAKIAIDQAFKQSPYLNIK